MHRTSHHVKIFNGTYLLVLIVFCLVIGSGFLAGRAAGEWAGTLVGKGIGSLEGIEQFKKAMGDGKGAGINSGDITVTLKQAFAEAGDLQVLTVDASCDNFQGLGDEDQKATRLLVVYPTKTVFTVDLNQAQIIADLQKKTISIVLPEPQAELNVDYGKAEILAKKQFFSPLVGTEDEMLSQIISQNEMTKSAETALGKELMESARDAARSQVYALCQNLSDGTYRIEESNITFRTEGA